MRIRVQHLNRQIYTIELEPPLTIEADSAQGSIITDAHGAAYYFDRDGHYGGRRVEDTPEEAG